MVATGLSEDGYQEVSLRRVVRIVNGGTPSANEAYWDGDVEWATPVDLAKVDGGCLGSTDRTLTTAGLAEGSRSIPGGSLVLSTRAPIGYVAMVDQPTAFNQGCRGLIPSERIDARFLQLTLMARKSLLESLGTGSTFKELSTEALGGVQIPLPPMEEQRRIADFLDDQVARIDAAKGARDQQLSLIDARFGATLKDLVLGRGSQSLGWAKGIGDDRAFLPLGRLMMLRGEKNDPVRVHQILSLTAKRGVIPYEEKGDIGNKASEDISRYSIVQPGDIVVNSMNVIIGSVGLSEYEGVLSPVYYVMKSIPNSRALSEFVALHFRIREFQQQLIKLGYGILEHRMRIPWINLKAELLAVPSLETQRVVVEALSSLDADRKASLATVQSGIDLLEERKRSLITAAVTGEMDVSTARPLMTGSV